MASGKVISFPKKKAPESAVTQIICPTCEGEQFNLLVGGEPTEGLPFTAASLVCASPECDFHDLLMLSWHDHEGEEPRG